MIIVQILLMSLLDSKKGSIVLKFSSEKFRTHTLFNNAFFSKTTKCCQSKHPVTLKIQTKKCQPSVSKGAM